MQKILRRYTETLLVVLAFALLGIIVAFFTFGVNDVVAQVKRALEFTPPQTKVGFDLQSAAKLNYHGLVSTSTQQ